MILTATASRLVDQQAVELLGIPSLLLMENAGRSLVQALVTHCQTPLEQLRVLLCCGRGNNGGDGFVMARRLFLLGAQVEVLAVSARDTYQGDAAINLTILEKIIGQFASKEQACNLKLSFFEQARLGRERLDSLLTRADWVVDALLGTGATGNLKPPYDQLVKQINRSGKRVFAVDIPTGLNPDTGEGADQAIRADVTCTLIAAKPGLLVGKAASRVGKLEIGDIGILPDWMDNAPKNGK